MQKDYLDISQANDLKNQKEKFLYRLLEIFPGFLSWGTLISALIGYTKKDAVATSCVSSASGKEECFRIHLSVFETLGKRLEGFEVACHSLLEQGVEWLIGMNFLEQFDFCIFPSKKIIRI